MVLDRLRLFGSDAAAPVAPRERVPGGEPLTFREFLDDACRLWGDKVTFQQKVRREWQRASNEHVRNQGYELAAGLHALGVRKGDRVAIIAENGIEWVCAYFSIVLAGAIAVPIYYDLRPGEVEEALTRSGATVAYVSQKSHQKFERALAGVPTLVVIGERRQGDVPREFRRSAGDALDYDQLAARASGETREAIARLEAEPDDVASIVFTSGTSGGMKGVMLTHRNFMANLQQVRRSIPFTGSDRLAMVLPLHHAFPFIVTVVVAPYVGGEVTFENDLRRIRDRMAEIKPTLFLGVPQLFEVMWRNILHSIEVQGRMETFQKGLRIVDATKKRTGVNIGRIVFRELHKRLGGSLRFAVCGGAALNPQVAANFARIGLPVLQGWGLTEAAPVLAVQRWHPRKFYMSNYYEERFGTVGQALDGIEIGLIDVPEKELYVHLHGEGELVARGNNVTPGYWQAEDATRAAKVGEWLRTGDVGRIDEEGNVWITGRSKFVIVLDSGEKIHPDEVEEKLDRGEAIEDIAVLGKRIRTKQQAWAVIYPNRDVVLERLGREDATEDDVRRIIQTEIEEQSAEIAPYKRIVGFMLTDAPLPKTPGLRKVMRGHLLEEYTFDPRRWAATWPEHLESIATPGSGNAESEDEDLATAVAAQL
jgi:long-chain acyl-CoA synthetase